MSRNVSLITSSRPAIVERYIAESTTIAVQCAKLSWEFIDTGDDFADAVSAAVERHRRLR
jgi:hypothetical protein